ncbi:beta-N-acetylhexosaminidase [Actinocatenispora rupis]|uniref:beta-N-acetylhexosaminidase n=1 Tax=Actinocatenispora rupis TaxID=519421 RepID=A0A8J3J1K5_9ACTN|nr:beta-N-acetylhexosaminidase [Actinocatenispora rupis]GID10390.1 hypothetical protein Aru02nite_12790 [Actinocatenispora rupis]
MTRHRARGTVAALLAAVLAASVAGAPASAAPDTNPAPAVVPSLARWTGGTGSTAVTAGSRIVLDWTGPAAQRIRADAGTFADDLAAVTGVRPPVVTGTARAGDIVLSTADTPKQAYRLDIGATVRISAADSDGAFYAEQTVEQILRLAPGHTTLPRGAATDAPDYRHRGYLLDPARHFYSVADVERHLRTAAWHKMNVVHLHLTDSYAIRVPSARYPGLVSDRHYTVSQIREIVAYAERYHVTLIPEFDVPGHSNQLTARMPALAWGCRSLADIGNLNVTKPAALTVVTDLLREWTALFPNSPILHIGGDEYAGVDQQKACPELVDYATAHGYRSTVDVIVAWQNRLAAAVTAMGRTPEMWNWWDYIGGATIAPDKDILIDAWYGATPRSYLDAGYQVVASPDPDFYVVPTKPPGDWWVANTTTMYTSYDYVHDDRLWGYEVSLFNDDLADTSDAYPDWFAQRPLEVLAETTWHGPGHREYPSVFAFEEAADRVGPPPGPPNPITPDVVPLKGSVYGNVADPAPAFDGDPGTYVDGAAADGGYVGIDLGAGHAAPVDRIAFVPRGNDVQPTLTMVGGRFEGCTDGPTSGCHTLATVEWRPTADWRILPVADTTPYRWLRYVSPDGGHTNVGEIRFETGAGPGRSTVDGPDTVVALGSGTMTATFTNSGDDPVHDVRLGLAALSTEDSAELDATATGRTDFGTVAAHRTVTATFRVRPDVGAGGHYLAVADTTYRTAEGTARSLARHGFDVPEPVSASLSRTAVVVPGDTALTVRGATTRPVRVDWSVGDTAVTVSPRHGTLTVPAGGTATARLTVTADAGSPGTTAIPVSYTAHADGVTRQYEPLTVRASVPYPDLAAAYDNVGITDDAETDPPNLDGGLDGSGSTFSAQALAAAGVTPGGTVTAGGLHFTWPATDPARPDNALANGQTIALSGKGSRLGLLTSSSFGPLSGTGTVTYTDGSTTSFTVDDPDWTVWPVPADATLAVTTEYRNYQGSQVPHHADVFLHTVPLDPGRTVAAVTLPPVGTRTLWTPALHVWSVTVG